MKISLNWLRRYIQLEQPIDKISEILTDIGLEVEGLEQVQSIKGGLEGIVVGHVIEKDKHPDADRLSLTKVNVGQEEALSIVCGAPNVDVGQKVLVATIGTTLYTTEGEAWKIKKSKIRGALSEGMICAEDELGLGQGHDGIMVLPEDVPVGTLAKDYFEVETDHVFEIGLTPNRSDATSHYGVAQDFAAYLKVNEGFSGNIKSPDVKNFKVDHTNDKFDVTVENETACPRYSGITISGIEIKESPKWLQNRLNSLGVRPINNIVDITNFILHDLGQPLHAFDADVIENKKIVVKTLPQDSKFVTLDEKERKLNDTDLMICDGNSNGLCIAGVFGGIGSGVTDQTKNIFLESAHFDAGFIRRTSTSHLLRTDAAKVFEKGSDPNITVIALKKAAMMIKELAGGMISSEIEDIYPKKITPHEIQLKFSNVEKIIGTKISESEITNILQAMNMELKPIDANSIMVKVPTNKADVLREADVIEEILRIYGFNKVPIPSKIRSTINYTEWPNKRYILNHLADYLASNGFNEIMGLSLIESQLYDKVMPIDHDKLVFINNTSNIHLDIMRPEPLLSGLETILRNQNHQQNDLKLFELGKAYQKDGDDFQESEFLSLYIKGNTQLESWKTNTTKSDFYDLKKWVQRILDKLNINKYKVNESEAATYDYAMEYQVGGETIVSFGALSSKILKKMDLKSEVFYAKFNVKPLINHVATQGFAVKEISKYPTMRRDLALVCDDKVKFGEIEKISKQAVQQLLKEVSLFDVYKSKDQLGEGKKSYAVKFVFEDKSKTLSDKEIDKVIENLSSKLKDKLGTYIRQ